MLTENTRLAYVTVAFDLAGNVSAVSRQTRTVLDRDGVPSKEIEVHPMELLFVAQPTDQDTIVDGLAEAQAKIAAI